MVDFEDHRDPVCHRSPYDSYYKTVYHRERSRSYRLSRTDDYRYGESHKKYISRNDFSHRHRSRSRSRNYNRSESYSRHEGRSRRDSYVDQNELFYYSKSNNIIQNRSRSPVYIEHAHQKLRKPLFNMSTNNEFEITTHIHKGNYEKNVKPYLIIDDMIYEKENELDYRKSKISLDVFPKKKSLLGDGPKVQRIHSVPYHSDAILKKMCFETIDLMNSQYYECGNIQHKRVEIDPESPVSGKLSDLSISINSNSLESENKIEIIDYNHVNTFDISVNGNYLGNFDPTVVNNEEPIVMSSDTCAQPFNTENSTNNIEYLDQIKNLANLLTQNDTKEVTVKWRLIPLFAPLRAKITENNIDVNSCSEYDPRIQHIVNKTEL